MRCGAWLASEFFDDCAPLLLHVVRSARCCSCVVITLGAPSLARQVTLYDRLLDTSGAVSLECRLRAPAESLFQMTASNRLPLTGMQAIGRAARPDLTVSHPATQTSMTTGEMQRFVQAHCSAVRVVVTQCFAMRFSDRKCWTVSFRDTEQACYRGSAGARRLNTRCVLMIR